MAETMLTCPACSTTLRLNQEVPPGKKVKCPKCGVQFAPGEEVVEGAVLTEEPPRSRRRDDDDYDDRPRRRRRDDDYDDDRPRRRRPERKPRSVIALLLILAAIVLVPVIVLGGGYMILVKPDRGVKLPENAAPPPNMGNQNPPPNNNQGKAKPKGNPDEEGVEVGNKAPEIAGEDLDGKKFKLSDYRGKVVLLDFWGNW
jgi:predicted Zn finger-like uncharacterized protein